MDGPRNNLRLLFLCEEWLPEIRALNGSRNGRSSEKAQVVGRPGETRIGNSSKRREYSPNGVLRWAEYNLLEIVFFKKNTASPKIRSVHSRSHSNGLSIGESRTAWEGSCGFQWNHSTLWYSRRRSAKKFFEKRIWVWITKDLKRTTEENKAEKPVKALRSNLHGRHKATYRKRLWTLRSEKSKKEIKMREKLWSTVVNLNGQLKWQCLDRRRSAIGAGVNYIRQGRLLFGFRMVLRRTSFEWMQTPRMETLRIETIRMQVH